MKISSENFAKSLSAIFNSAYSFLTYASGDKLPKEGEDFKSCFHLLDRYERPGEFLESFLDILRVMYFNHPIGTLLLNSNPSFITSAVPEIDFGFSYLSVVSDENEKFQSFWDRRVLTKLSDVIDKIEEINNAFVVISTSNKRHPLELYKEVSDILSVGISADDALNLYGSHLNDQMCTIEEKYITGFCEDNGLGSKTRVSMWIFSGRGSF